MIHLGTTWYTPLAVIALTFGFYAATLEEYYCKRLDLPLINGVSDGWVIVYFIGIMSGLGGREVWEIEVFYGFTFAQLIVIAVSIAAGPTAALKYYNFKNSFIAIFKKKPGFFDVLKNTSMYFLIYGTFLIHYTYTSLSSWYIRLIVAMSGLMTWKILLHIMLSHVTSQVFKPFNKSVIISCFIILIYFLTPIKTVIPENFLVWTFLSYNSLGKN